MTISAASKDTDATDYHGLIQIKAHIHGCHGRQTMTEANKRNAGYPDLVKIPFISVKG
jgi:hypothetical protein